MSDQINNILAADTLLILDHVSDAVAVVDTQWRSIYFNQVFEKTVGRTKDEMLGKICWELAPQIVGTVYEQRLREAMEQRKPVVFEAYYSRLDIHLEVSAFPTKESLTLFFRNVTGQKRAEEMVRDSDESFQRIFEACPIGLYTLNNKGEFLQVNSMFVKMLGYSVEELKHLTVKKITYREDLDADNELIYGIVDGTISKFSREKRFIKKNGSILWTSRTATVLRDASGKVKWYMGMIEDITERKKYEMSLQESEASHRAMFDLATIGMTQSELGTGNFMRVNETFCQITGYSEAEMLKLRFSDLDHPDDRERSQATFQTLASRASSSYEIVKRYLRKDHRIIWVHVNVITVRAPDGTPLYYLGVVQDITFRKQWESELQQAKEQAEAASRAKDQFLAVLSHELRTPLTPILAMAQIMENDPQLTSEQQKSMALICRNVEVEARLIDDLLDLTRINRGKLLLQINRVDLHKKISNVIEMLQGEIARKELKLEMQLEAQEFFIRGDSARIQQILWNLVQNAIKFTTAGGTIKVSTRNPTPETICLEVKDTGIGITPEILPNIFNAFEQGGVDVTKRFGGLGLGLAITRGLVQMHGGTLSAHSDGHGCGSTFTVVLQAEHQSIRGMRPSVLGGGIQSSNSVRKVLLVEDHPDTARVMQKLLMGYGFKVTLASTVASALSVAENNSFDLLISDIGLPDGTGLDIMETLVKKQPILGIAISGYGMDEDIQRSKQAGFFTHLTKPVDVKALDQVLSGLVPKI